MRAGVLFSIDALVVRDRLANHRFGVHVVIAQASRANIPQALNLRLNGAVVAANIIGRGRSTPACGLNLRLERSLPQLVT